MANWLEEMIARAIGRVMSGEEYPGFTQNRMMANQGPMGTPMQSPDQYDIPYRTPYGNDGIIREGDIKHPLGRAGWRGATGVGNALRERGAENVDSWGEGIASRYPTFTPEGFDPSVYGDSMTEDTVRQVMLEAAKRQAIARLLSSGSR